MEAKAIMINPRVGIVGAGPAGLTCAISAVTLGLDVAVFERADNFQQLGGGIALQSNRLRVLQKLELLPALRSYIYPCSAFVLELSSKHEIVSNYRMLGVPHNSFSVLLRYDLQECLRTAARQKWVPILFGHRCVGVEIQNKKAVLRFAGESDQVFDAVIGADGIRSAVRESLGWQGKSKTTGETYLRGVADTSTGESAAREIWDIDGRRFGMCPLPANKTYFYCSVPKGEWTDILTKRLRPWIDGWQAYGTKVMTVLERVSDWHHVKYDEVHEIRLKQWSNPPVFLVGDAAHGMTPNYGQGANCAMVDALVLTTLLARAFHDGSDLEQTGRVYESVRRPFVDRIQNASARFGVFAQWRSPAARLFRDNLLLLTSRIAALRRRELRLIVGYNPKEESFLR
jgi:2-polyprenyl-6-methoxyphenol hydroxylase-like FAD-dependent oxidoreductase